MPLLRDLPVEIIDYFCSFLETTQDLLYLALTCKAFYFLIVPNHLFFCELRSHIFHSELWTALAAIPHKTARFRRLQLTPELWNSKFQYLAPLDITLPLDTQDGAAEKIESHLLPLLSNLTSLNRFSWCSDSTRGPDFVDAIFKTIQDSCPNLSELQVDLVDSFDVSFERLCTIRNLTKVSITVKTFVFNPSQLKSGPLLINRLIDYCPSLQDLHIDMVATKFSLHVPQLLQRASWPRLRRLTLTQYVELYDLAHSDDFNVSLTREFLKRHPLIECLSVNEPRFFLLASKNTPHINLFPSLISVSFPALDFMMYPSSILSQLRTMGTVGFSSPQYGIPHLQNISVVYTGYDILIQILKMIPQIEQLKLTPSLRTYFGTRLPSEEHYEVILNLKHLSYLSGFWFAHSSDHMPFATFANTIVTRLSNLKTLRYIDIPIASHSSTELVENWLKIQRNTDNEYVGWDPMTTSHHIHSRTWGNVFMNLDEY